MTWTTIIWVGVTNPRSGGKSTNISKYHVAYYIRTFIVNLYGRREREREPSYMTVVLLLHPRVHVDREQIFGPKE